MDLGRAPERGPRAESAVRVIALMILSFALLVALCTLALVPLFAVSQPCPVDLQPCDGPPSVVVATLLLGVPFAAVLVGIVGGAVQLVRRRTAIRWPAIACAVAVGSWLVGLALALLWP